MFWREEFPISHKTSKDQETPILQTPSSLEILGFMGSQLRIHQPSAVWGENPNERRHNASPINYVRKLIPHTAGRVSLNGQDTTPWLTSIWVTEGVHDGRFLDLSTQTSSTRKVLKFTLKNTNGRSREEDHGINKTVRLESFDKTLDSSWKPPFHYEPT